MTEKDLLLQKITEFINGIGIPCQQGPIDTETFLPGVDIVKGSIVYDPDKLLSAGDLLHEAGHIAVLPENIRKTVSSPDVCGDLQDGGAEMAAIAWSWAALKHLDISPDVVFHPEGYKGESGNIITNFTNTKYFGVSLLQWFGMTTERKNATNPNDIIYPKMSHWLRPHPATL